MSIPEAVAELLDPLVATLDVELLDVEWNGNSLRVVVDRTWGPDEVIDKTNGITTQQLADVNRLIGPVLDQHDPVPGRYTLEVSSPGVERKLTKPDHYRRAVGEQVVIKMMPQATPRRVKGALLSFDDEAGVIEVMGDEIDGIDQANPEPKTIEVSLVQKARTSFEWGPAPKPGGPKPGAKKKSGSTTASSKNAASGKKQEKLNEKLNRPEEDPT